MRGQGLFRLRLAGANVFVGVVGAVWRRGRVSVGLGSRGH